MSFSPEWLALREPADHASRAADIASEVSRCFSGRARLRVLDLGCGTGSNLRKTFELLPARQDWLLVDHDQTLLEAAARALTDWADSAEQAPGGVSLTKDGKSIAVRFRRLDLAKGLPAGLAAPDLVTASALFDLVSPEWMAAFARDVAGLGAAFYTVLTYDGRDAFTPPHPADERVIAAFAQHQKQDKGLGVAAGPAAAEALAQAFRAAGFKVSEGDSAWRLGPRDKELQRQLLAGVAAAVRETEKLGKAELASWLAFRQAQTKDPVASLVTGHRDTFARPQ